MLTSLLKLLVAKNLRARARRKNSELATMLRAAALVSRRVGGVRALSDYAVAPYRSLARASAADRARWAADDLELHAAMRAHVPAALKHNGEEAFDDHLVAVQSVLRAWGAPDHLAKAALFHSIYGTEGFQGYALPLAQRGEIAALVGAEAERLAWIFCVVDRASVDATVLGDTAVDAAEADADAPGAIAFAARAELGAFAIPLASKREWLDFLALSLADWLEQVEGAATKRVPSPIGLDDLWAEGHAWGYRRRAYAAMANVLGAHGDPWVAAAAPEMHALVYAREPEATRAFEIPLTPPTSAAALAAQEAIASAAFVVPHA